VALACAAGTLSLAFRAVPAHAGDWSIGGRAGSEWMFLEGDVSTSDLRGFVFGVDAAYSVGRRMALGADLDASIYTQRSDRLPPGPTADSFATFLELRIDTNPEGPFSARIDLGTGYRFLMLPLASGPTDRFGAWEALRLRVGPAWRASSGVQVAVVAGFGFGWFASRGRDGACAVIGTCSDSLYDSDAQSPVHFVSELALTVRGWP
jgi:hypothetical protein